MRHGLSIFLIAGFLGVAVFGFLGMDMGGYGHMDCLATAVQGEVCPEALDAAGFIDFHFNAARFFSTAVLTLSILVILWVLVAGTFILGRWYEPPVVSKCRLPQFLLLPVSLPREILKFLLILHEKRDPVLSFASV